MDARAFAVVGGTETEARLAGSFSPGLLILKVPGDPEIIDGWRVETEGWTASGGRVITSCPGVFAVVASRPAKLTPPP